MSASTNKDVKIAPGAIVCLESKLQGSITIGSMTVIHPKASIIAEAGPVIIGENNILEEQASIIYKSQDEEIQENLIPLNIGVNNVFEVGCEIHAKTIGDHNVFESKCFVGPNVEIGNGCIIGAGCRITSAEKLPDQTVITGRDCVRSIALDRPPAPEDAISQHDELTVLSEIFTKDEFTSYSKGSDNYAIFEAHLPLPSIFSLRLNKDLAQNVFLVRHLPPIRLIVSLPQNYPSQSPPYFALSCCWLDKSKLDLLLVELERLWEENKSEILFVWYSFLRDQLLEFLNINDGIDLSEKCRLNLNLCNITNNEAKADDLVSNCAQITIAGSSKKIKKNKRITSNINKSNLSQGEINGDENGLLRLKATKKQGYELIEKYHKEAKRHLFNDLIEYNVLKSNEEFKKTLKDCNICFSSVLGEFCKKLDCGHVSCTECLKRMCEVHIKYGTTESLVCSQENCGADIPVNLIQELVPKELYDQYDQLMLSKTLDKISNMTYCPRVHCQYPVSTQSEDGLAICPSCDYAFCIHCKRTYHGVEGCRFKSNEKKDLIEAYQNGSYEEKLNIEKRYGKKQITELVNTAQSELWMLENSKKCPSCHVNIEKNYGCNKIICKKCNTHFCWLCLTRLSSHDPYHHFRDPKSKCFNLLIEAEEEDDNEDIQDDELEYDEDFEEDEYA